MKGFAAKLRVPLVLSVLALPLLAAAPAAGARFFQFNMCGSVQPSAANDFECNGGDTDPVANAVKNSILDFRPQGVSLNEACFAQFDAIRDRLGGTAWEMHGTWVQTNWSNNCPGDNFGNAVLTVNPIADRDVYRLQHDPGEEIRTLLCARTELVSRTSRVCSVHIETASDPAEQRAQIQEVANRTDAYIDNGRPVVLMGDFNVEPPSPFLDPIYHGTIFGSGAEGRFKEVDQGDPACRCGESTHGSRKIDYIFLNGRDWTIDDGDATFSDYSDHDPLRGWASPQ